MPPTAEPLPAAESASPEAPARPAPASPAGSATCRWCFDPVNPRALRCPHCHSYLSEQGRQQAVRELLSSLGLRSVEVGQPGVWGLTIPAAILFVVFAYFLARGLFTILGSQPALLQVLIGTIGIILVVALGRERTRP